MKMNPVYDPVCILLKTPFSNWRDKDKKDLLAQGRPTVDLTVSTKKSNKKSGKSYNLNFRSSWFMEYKWLCSSIFLQKLFCWPCLLFSTKQFVWNREGYVDIFNITRALHKHEDSAEHIKCEVLLKNVCKNQNITGDNMMDNSRLDVLKFNENVRLNRICWQTIIDAVLYHSKQKLALYYGPDENINLSIQENFKELVKLLIERSSPEVKNHYEKIKTHITGDLETIQNDLIQCISGYIVDHIKNEINESNFFSVQIIDATHIIQTPYCSVIMRFVDSHGLLVERFMGFHDVRDGKTAENLFLKLHPNFEKINYPEKLVGQSYDGTAVLFRHLNGLQKKIKEKAPQALFVHCLTYHLTLLLYQTLINSSKYQLFLKRINDMSCFFHNLSKQSTLPSTLPHSAPIPRLNSCWSSNNGLLDVIIQDWDKIREFFRKMSSSCKESDRHSAIGFLENMNDFGFIFLAVLFNDVFMETNRLNHVLKEKSLDPDYCVNKIKQTREILNKKREEDQFRGIYSKARKMTPVRNGILRDDFTGLLPDFNIASYRELFFDLLNHTLSEIAVRFEDYGKLNFVGLGDSTKFAEYSASFPSGAFDSAIKQFKKIFTKTQRLRNELVLIYGDEKYRNLPLQKLLTKLEKHKNIFTEAYKLFCLILTVPSTSTLVESALNQKRLNIFSNKNIFEKRRFCLATMAYYRKLLSELKQQRPFYEDIIDKFASLKERKILEKIELVYNNSIKTDRQAYVETHSVSVQLDSCSTHYEDYQIDQSNEEGAIQETEQSGNNTGEVVLKDEIKGEVDDDFFAESQDELLLTKEEILTLVTETNSEKTATVDLVKEEPESDDENEPPEKRSRVEFSQVSNDLNQPGPSRVATTDEPQTHLENSTSVTHIDQKDLALDNLLTYSGDLEMFFKTILSVAQKLDPVDQVILQRNITNAVFDIKIKQMTNKKS